MLTKFKKRVESHLYTVALILDRIGLEPNHLTVMSLFFSTIGFTMVVFFRSKPALLLFTALSGLMDALDGALARCKGKSTKLGAFLDSTIDRLSDTLIIASLILLGYPQTVVLTLLVSSMLISYTRARAEALGVELEKIGLIERPERLVLIMATIALGLIHYGASLILLIVLTALSVFTFIQRLIHTINKLSSRS